MLLYDFICDNELYVANFLHKQPVNYIYDKGTHSTYIDHVLVSQEYNNMIPDYKIINSYYENTSDHLPIRTSIILSVKDLQNTHRNDIEYNNVLKFPTVDWCNETQRDAYRNNIQESAKKLPTIDFISVGAENTKSVVNKASKVLLSKPFTNVVQIYQVLVIPSRRVLVIKYKKTLVESRL
ncbi:hypothetical protein LSH36_122g09015 [Paralvinella palmiformis]|uniref:Endonuclease/exonuclease/phosphatase domain-containing protein n=1 Tax=Paralvinella palmiformis TaxID=53620 RepID=A0AAD9JYZ3_9ANNE|nr:hypothetical protein LSH36_122g09015 [Paralvinella palmiformis]